MDSILLPIHGKWCEPIIRGEKTVEVRKVALQTPFKVYIYETKGTKFNHKENRDLAQLFLRKALEQAQGKVIGEFICDKIDKYEYYNELPYDKYNLPKSVLKNMCLTCHDVDKYGAGKPLYGWHISNLKIYGDAKPLTSFKRPHNRANCGVKDCGYSINGQCGNSRICDYLVIRKAPQSWCFAEPL